MTPTSARWIAAAALAAVVAACAWIFATTVTDDDAALPARNVAAAPPSERDAAAHRAAAVAVKGDAAAATPAVIEIDDAPLPADATGTVRGTVRDDLGKPVVGAWVEVIAFDVVTPENSVYRSWHSASGADGSYEIEDLDPVIVWRLEARADRHAPGRPASAVVFSAQHLEATYDFVLPRQGSIDATVLGADGAAIRHEVQIVPLNDDRDKWGADAGSFAPGRYRVFASAAGRAGECRVVDVVAGETTRIEFRLADEAVITGALLDSDGTPLAKYGIVAFADDGGTFRPCPRGVTAADGTFRIGGLRHAAYRLATDDERFAADTPGPVTAPASGVRVQLRDDAKVTFHLVYPADFTASDRSADVRVDVTVRDTDLTPSPRWDLDVGTVVVPGGEDAEVAVTAIHCLTVRRRVKVRPGETLDIGDVRPERAGEVSGRVVDASGTAVSDAAVLVENAPWVFRQITTDDGSFHLDRVPRDGCVLDVEAPGFAPARVEFRAGDAPPTIVLQRGGALWIRGNTRAGQPARGVAVHLTDAAGAAWPFLRDRLDEHGECAARLPPGRWRVEVTGCAPADADVREGATTTVRLVAGGR